MNRDRLGLGPALLFCPADRPDRYPKALERADAVILDLEDGVAPARRVAARSALVGFGEEETGEADRVIVRVSPVSSPDHVADVAAVLRTPFRTIMLAKTEADEQVTALASAVDGARVLALCETAAGVLHAAAIAEHPSTVGLMWGAEDLIVSLGGTASRTPAGAYRDVARHARSAVLLAAAAHGVDAIDAVHVDLDDLNGLAEEAADAVASGFSATACLHPRQVAVVREAYRPSREETERARRVVQAARDAAGAFRLDGQMVDEPLIAQARAVVKRAESFGE